MDIFAFTEVFSSLDLIKGFFQIPVSEPHRKFYAFSDGRRHLEYCRCPMGSKNSGATMASLMEIIFRGFPPHYLLSYLDDIFLATTDTRTHLDMLKRIFSAFFLTPQIHNNLPYCMRLPEGIGTLNFICVRL